MSIQHSLTKRLLLLVSISILSISVPQASLAASALLPSAQKEFVLGNYDKVVVLLKGKTDVDSVILVSRARHMLDDVDDKALAEICRKEPNNEKALTAMAFIEEESRHYRDAESSVARVFKISHSNARAVAVLALCKIRQGNEGLGVKILGDALKMGDQDTVVLELAQGAYDCLFDSEQTEKMCDRLIQLEPRNPHFWTMKGKFMERAGHPDKAIDCYSKAISINPRFDFAYTNRARIYFERKEHLKVIKDTSTCIAAHITKGQVLDCLALRANTYAILNKHAEAIADIKEFLRLTDAVHHPQFEKQDDAYLHLSLEYIALGKYSDAENALAQLKKLNRRNSEVLDQEAIIQSRLGHKEAALKIYEKLVAEDGNNSNWAAAIKKLKGQ
jgi:tetratricopeptide (TPR) repeat protein